ncbi:MAG: EAL domain-containing protein, partial [Oscillibacter sp.]|nr:EAL domain-containing protein [Oscillibacter sp.]
MSAKSNNTRESSLESYILSHLDEAIQKGYIKAYYQPVIRTVSRQLCGLEALARWDDPIWGLLPPDSFISILEKHRKIHHLDSFIIREVCACYRQNVVREGAPLPVSINLSRLDYELCDIFAVVEKAVRENKVPRQSLCIEITESALNEQVELMRYYIERFRNAGYQVWMDDFGSGYSSLNVLKDYQFDELKIDMAFLSDFHSRSKEILTSIVDMAKAINIQTLVEGVETEEQFEFLRNIGCEKVQGFLFGKPLPYMDCIRNVEQQGVPIEPPVYRKYYDDLGRVNVLSATPFLSAVDRKAHTTGRDRNSIPLATLELSNGNVRLLFSNDAFDRTAAALDWNMVFGAPTEYLLRQDTLRLNDLSAHLARLL